MGSPEGGRLVGTPGYMAPEMVDTTCGPLGAHTDVYLLGATLYEVLTGRPPHACETLLGTLGRALLGRHEPLPGELPEDLRAICECALAREPALRFADAESLRRAIGEHLERRSALRLGVRALERLAQLEALVADAAAGRAHDPVEIHGLLGEARFGLEQVLQAYPEHQAAAGGLLAMRRTMVGYELASGRLEAARAWLEGLPHDEPLREAVSAAYARQARASQEIAKLRELEADVDMGHGRTARFRATLKMAASWLALNVVAGWSARSGHFVAEHGTYALGLLAFALLAGLYTWRRRGELWGNAASRSITLTIFFGIFILTAFWLTADAVGVAFTTTMPLTLLVLSAATGVLAAFVDRRIFIGAGVFGASSIAAMLAPGFSYEVLGVANLVAFGHMAWVFSPDCGLTTRR